MKYLIPLYFILFLSILTIINVYSSAQATKKPLKTTTNQWKKLKAPLNGTMVQGLGKKAVETYNNRHKKQPKLSYMNVTRGLKKGRKSEGNKQIKLRIFVSRTDNKASSTLTCHNLVAIFNVATNGTKTLFKSRLKNATLDCNLENHTTPSLNDIKPVSKAK